MQKTMLNWFSRSLLVGAAIVATGCAKESPVSPVASAKTALFRDASDGDGLPDLSACPQLAAPEGSTLVPQLVPFQ